MHLTFQEMNFDINDAYNNAHINYHQLRKVGLIFAHLQKCYCLNYKSNHGGKCHQWKGAQNGRGIVLSSSCKDLVQQPQKRSSIQHCSCQKALSGLLHHNTCHWDMGCSLVHASNSSGYCKFQSDISSSLLPCHLDSRSPQGSRVLRNWSCLF